MLSISVRGRIRIFGIGIGRRDGMRRGLAEEIVVPSWESGRSRASLQRIRRPKRQGLYTFLQSDKLAIAYS
jgi:hypothetical protein